MKTTTKGIVIREQTVGESDRLVTLLTADFGIVKAFVRRANNIKNKNNYNKESHVKKNNKANFEQRDYAGFDFTKLYANASAFS